MTAGTSIPAWYAEIVDAYAKWSADENGLGHDAGAEVDREPREWNDRFYQLVAKGMLEGGQRRFDTLVRQITGLPDRSFGDVSESLIHAADVWYFNDAKRSPVPLVAMRRGWSPGRWNWGAGNREGGRAT